VGVGRQGCDTGREMTDQRSPWAQADTEVVLAPVQGTPSEPITVGADRPAPVAAARYRSGNISALSAAPPPPHPPDVIFGGPGDGDDDPVKRNRRILKWLGGGAVGVVALGLVILLGMVMTGNVNPNGLLNRAAKGPSDTRPRLAKQCPPPSDTAEAPNAPVPAAPPGPRIVDSDSGVSYRQYGAPWQALDHPWQAQGDLNVVFRSGQQILTEPNFDGLGNDYYATILSSHVPAAVNDGLTLDLPCAGHQVAADVRAIFYPPKNSMTMLRDEAVTVGGRKAWVQKFRMKLEQEGLKAKSELVMIAVVDVGRPDAAIVYVSIPDTNSNLDYVADDIIDTIRPAS
jgi:hypothetical protein